MIEDTLIQNWIKEFDELFKKQKHNWTENIRVVDYNEKKLNTEDFLKEKIKEHNL